MSILTIALKDLHLLVRDRAALLFVLLVPIAVVTIVAETLGGEAAGVIQLPVVNEDEGPVAEVLIETLSKHVEVLLVDRERALEIVQRDKQAGAALVLPERLSKRYLSGRPSSLVLLTDPAKGKEVGTVKAYFLLADRDAQAIADPLSEELLVLEEQNVTGTRLTTDDFEQTVPGFSVMFVLMGVLFGVAFGLQDEKEWGTSTRIRIAPISRLEYLLGKLLARLFVGLAQMLILFGFGHLVWDISLGPQPIAFLLLSMAIVFAMTGFSLVVACFVRSREQIIPLGLTVIMIVCSIGGCWWPLFMEPLWLQRIARVTPTAWAMEGINDLMLRERSLGEILPGIGVLGAYGSACIALGVRLYRA